MGELGLSRSFGRVLLAALGLGAAGAVAFLWLDSAGGIDAISARYGMWSALVLVPLQTAISLTFSPIPSDVVAFANSMIYGFWLGTLFNWIGWMAGALIQYAVVRRAARPIDPHELRERLPDWMQRYPPDHPAFLICARWFPLGPHVVNTIAGTLRVPLPRYVACAAIGILPVAMIVAGVATGVRLL